MKRFYVFGLVMVAVGAVGVMSAAGASAVTFLLAEWLEGGSPVTATLLFETPETVLFDEELDGIPIHLVCSVILDGFIGPDGAEEVTELLQLSGEPISLTGLAGTADTCTNEENCAEPLFWETELPRLGLLDLMEDGTETFFANLVASEKTGGQVGYEFECMSLGLSDTCTVTEAVALAENSAEGLNIETSEAFTELAGLKLPNCSVGGTEKLIVEGLGIMKSSGGGALTVSE